VHEIRKYKFYDITCSDVLFVVHRYHYKFVGLAGIGVDRATVLLILIRVLHIHVLYTMNRYKSTYLSICFGNSVIELPNRRVRLRYGAGQLGSNIIVPAHHIPQLNIFNKHN